MDLDDGSFEEWYRAEHPRLITVLAAVTGDAEVACEATDEAFVRSYERWDRVSVMASRSGWVYRTALHEARRRIRRRLVERRLWLSRSDAATIPGPTGELWLVVADLPQRQREALVLRHVAHLTEIEVARVMSVSRGTVSSTLRDAYRSLRSHLSENEASYERGVPLKGVAND